MNVMRSPADVDEYATASPQLSGALIDRGPVARYLEFECRRKCFSESIGDDVILVRPGKQR